MFCGYEWHYDRVCVVLHDSWIRVALKGEEGREIAVVEAIVRLGHGQHHYKGINPE